MQLHSAGVAGSTVVFPVQCAVYRMPTTNCRAGTVLEKYGPSNELFVQVVVHTDHTKFLIIIGGHCLLENTTVDELTAMDHFKY